MKKFFLAICMLPLCVGAQTFVSGVVNKYTHVHYIDSSSVLVDSASFLTTEDNVLLIQMNGAGMDTTNTSSFGDVLNYNSAGHYEFLSVKSVSGNKVTFFSHILETYDTAYAVQVVKIPSYGSAIVSDTLTAAGWDGITGGVLALYAQKLTLNAPIYVSGKGFRGGWQCKNPDGGCGSGYSDYFYALLSGFGGEKGEGIVPVLAGKEVGRGAQSSGGGGGNKQNSGGGGGGNFSSGGAGGDQATFCSASPVGGRGGKALSYKSFGKRMFMGGGGGCSDYNNAVGTYGGNGGGIVVVVVDTIEGGGDSIISSGSDVGYTPNPIGDGAGGGGAGGSILLNVKSFGSTPLKVIANGGHGGDQDVVYPACFGPGGGGGVGVLIANRELAANVLLSTLPGTPGVDYHTTSTCYMASHGAGTGDTGTGYILRPDTTAVVVDTTTTHPVDPGRVTLNGKNVSPVVSCYNDQNLLVINCDNNYSSAKFSIVDAVGKMIVTEMPLYKSNKVDISTLPAGTYNVICNIAGGRVNSRFVK